MSRASDRLREFIDAFGLGNDHPWSKFIREETTELDDALREMESATADSQRFDRTYREMLARELADVRVTIEGAAIAHGIDLDAAFEAVMDANMAKLPDCEACHGEGYRHEFDCVNLQGPGGERLMCLACMGTGKGKPIKRESDGKVMKPAGWQEPDMSRAIRS